MINIQTLTPFLRRTLAIKYAFLALFIAPVLMYGQQTPVSAFLSPPDGLESGDLVDLTIEFGTEEEPSDYITEAHFEIILPEGMSVSEGSSAEVTGDNSWFAIDEDWYGTVETDPSGREMVVSLYRRDEEEVRGHGEIAVVKGWTITIEEIMMKNGQQPQIRVKPTSLDFLPIVTENLIRIDEAPEGTWFRIVDMSGRTLAEGNQPSFQLNTISGSALIIHGTSPEGQTGHKVVLTR